MHSLARTLGMTFAATALVIAPFAPASASASAQVPGVTDTDGDVTLLDTPPESVVLGELESDDDLFLFAERSNVTLAGPVAADIVEPGVYFADGTPDDQRTQANLPTGRVPAGTQVDSYFLSFDNAGYEFDLRDYFGCVGQIGVSGSVTFDRPIVGVVLRSWKLSRSNDDVGLAEVAYDTATLRHFPGVNVTDGCQSDQVTISADRKTLTTRNFTDIHHDNLRVLVEAID